MNKKYRIASKFRFTMFLTILILCVFTVIGFASGMNTVNSSSMNEYNQIEIHSGDTLWAIASHYGPADQDIRKTVYEICQLNDISADQLEAGQKILVPTYN
ncbi:LysM repeat protein [Clostridiales Family XIII bacterium PM5-7]